MIIYQDTPIVDGYIQYIIECWGYDESSIQVRRLSDFAFCNHAAKEFVVIAKLAAARKFFDRDDIDDGQVVVQDGVHYFCCHSFSYDQYAEGWLYGISRKLYLAHIEAERGKIVPHVTSYEWILTEDTMREVIAGIHEMGAVAVDTETNGLYHYTQKDFRVRLLSITYTQGHSYLLGIDDPESPSCLSEAMPLLYLFAQEVLQNPSIVKVGHNFKYDMHVLNHIGVGGFAGPIFDTMLMGHMIHRAEKRRYGLKQLVADYIPLLAGYQNVLEENVTTSSLATLAPYAAGDTDGTLRLFHVFLADMLATPQFIALYRSLICPTMYTLYDMERNGALVDNDFRQVMVTQAEEFLKAREHEMRRAPDFLAYDIKRRKAIKEQLVQGIKDNITERESQGKHLKKDGNLTEAHKKLQKQLEDILSGESNEVPEFSFTSSQQLGEFFYTSEHGLKLKMPYVRGKTNADSGYKPSTASEHLMLIADKTTVVAHLEAHREISKINQSYLTGFEQYIDSNSRIHPNFGQHTVETGRLSCKEPNLQTMPRGSSLGHEDTSMINDAAKSMFIVPKGRVLLQFDLSAAELRIMAHMSQDPGMLKVFADGLDPHATTAKALSGLTDEQWEALPKDKKKALRNKGKATNFLLIYQGSVKGFQYTSKISYGVEMSDEEAQDAYDKFFAAYPKIREFHEKQIRQAKDYHYCETLLGRQRTLAYYMNSHDEKHRAHAIRQAINTPCQGAGAEATQFIHAKLFRILTAHIPGKFEFFNQVHDSIMLYVDVEQAPFVYQKAQQVMQHLNDNLADYFHGRTFQNISLKIDAEYSLTNWKKLEPYEGEVIQL